METFILYLLPLLLLLPLSVYIVLKKSSDNRKILPPGSYGWPILGEYVDYAMSGTQKLVRERMQKYSPVVFKTMLFGERIAVLCGPRGNKFIFKNESKLTTWLPPTLSKVVHLGSVSGSTESKVMFRIFQYDVLKPEALKQYVPVIDSLAREHLDREWRPNSVVKVLESIKKYTFVLAWRLFMNVVDAERPRKLLEPFEAMTNGAISLYLDLPWTAFGRAVRGGKVVRGELKRMVAERRKKEEMSEGGDLLTTMALAAGEDGKPLTDTMIANFMIGILVGSQYEISSAFSVVMDYLARLPHIYDKVLEEQMEIAGDGLLTWEDLEKMKYTWNVVRESFRLTPPSLGSFREAPAEFIHEGFTIPKGWKIMWSPHSCHYNPEFFPEPEKFDPSRYEGSGPAPYTYVPFGGGQRICPGRGYAKLVILVLIHNVVTRFRLEKLIPNEKMMLHVAPKPTHGLPLRLHAHPK